MTNNTEQQAVPVAQSPASIWLSPACEITAHDGRTWANPAPATACDECGDPWVEYVRADLAPVSDATQTREAELVAVRMHALEEAAMIAQIFGVPGGHISDTARKVAEAIRFRATTLVPPKATPIAARKHALRRTSPKGGPFLGTCMQCGETGLPSNAVLKPCTNPANLTQDESLLLAIKPAASADSSVPDELRQDLEDAVSVLERLPYGNWPGDMYHGKVAAANGLIRRLRAALNARGGA